jgi:hypothetical protein
MTDSGHADDPSQLCRNCGAVRAARYCGECGQRALDPDERRLGHLVRDAIGALTNLDSRAWRTLIALLFRPGRLTRDYIDGRRAHWLAPFTIFILANIVFFVSPALTDFSLPFEDQVPGRLAIQAYDDPQSLNPAFRTYLERWEGQLHSPLTAPLVERRIAARNARWLETRDGTRGYTMADYKAAYESINPEVSKLLIGLHVPFMALALAVLFWRKRLFLAEHFVSALHLFSFSILLQQLLLGPAAILGRQFGGPWLMTAFQLLLPLSLVILTAYFVMALRRTYQTAWWWSVVATAVLLLAVLVIHLVIYRPVQFLLIHALI